MSQIDVFKKELEQEGNTTRRMLERIPDDQYDYQPHKKSMTIRALATHIAELPGWIPLAINTSELDFEASPYNPVHISDTAELLSYFEKTLAEGKASLETANEAEFGEPWILRSGAKILDTLTKA
ncbi:MAG: DinB family protein, partial [Chitinophagaceae bacterium]